MGATLLLLAALQIPGAPAAARHEPRFSIGAHVGGLGGFTGEGGGGAGIAGGIGISIPLGTRTAIDLRVTRLAAADGFVLWDARWHRILRPTSSRPYFAAGLAGVVAKEIRYRGSVRREDWEFWKPPMLSLATGWEVPAGARFTVPFEVGVMLHPYGLILGTISVGLNWAPSAR